MSQISLREAPFAAGRGRAAAWTREQAPSIVTGAAAFVTVFAISVDNGGYFPTAWGWAALGLFWLAGLAFVWVAAVEAGLLELLLVGALTAFAGWSALALIWTRDVTQSMVELERTLAYVAGLIAFLLIVRRRSVVWLLGGVLIAIVAVATYSLATRLFPERLGTFDPVTGYRLAEPVGYWNALGILVGLGALLALGFAARSTTLFRRALAGASTVVLITTLYFAFGRAVWVAFGVAIAIALLLDPRRLQLVVTILALAPGCAVSVAIAARSDALTHTNAVLSEASREGHRLAVAVLLLAIASGALIALVAFVERRWKPGAAYRRAFGAALALAGVAAAFAVFASAGAPWTVANRAYDRFTGPSPTNEPINLNERLFTFQGNARREMWRAAWRDARQNPVLGSGPGTYEATWLKERDLALSVRDAHGLFIEQLAEVGSVGLALLVLALLLPLAAVRRSRRHPLGAIVCAAYLMFVLHAGVDWDWEVPVLTLTAILFGVALVRMRGETPQRLLSTPARAVGVAVLVPLAALAFVGLVSNSAVSSSDRALEAEKWDKAEASARRVIRWAPWSSTGWDRLGEAQLGQNDVPGAVKSFRKALAKDPNDWDIWLDYAAAASGRERMRAFARAAALNPRAAEIDDFREALLRHQEPPWFL
jgi:hypothetical protein